MRAHRQPFLPSDIVTWMTYSIEGVGPQVCRYDLPPIDRAGPLSIQTIASGTHSRALYVIVKTLATIADSVSTPILTTSSDY